LLLSGGGRVRTTGIRHKRLLFGGCNHGNLPVECGASADAGTAFAIY
jgi:hypothetical protein